MVVYEDVADLGSNHVNLSPQNENKNSVIRGVPYPTRGRKFRVSKVFEKCFAMSDWDILADILLFNIIHFRLTCI